MKCAVKPVPALLALPLLGGAVRANDRPHASTGPNHSFDSLTTIQVGMKPLQPLPHARGSVFSHNNPMRMERDPRTRSVKIASKEHVP